MDCEDPALLALLNPIYLEGTVTGTLTMAASPGNLLAPGGWLGSCAPVTAGDLTITWHLAPESPLAALNADGFSNLKYTHTVLNPGAIYIRGSSYTPSGTFTSLTSQGNVELDVGNTAQACAAPTDVGLGGFEGANSGASTEAYFGTSHDLRAVEEGGGPTEPGLSAVPLAHQLLELGYGELYSG